MAEHNEIGKIGEKITRTFLVKHGFSILDTNYHTRYGELDIVAKKDNRLHFIEVKSVKVRSFDRLDTLHVKPEDNLTIDKWTKFVVTVKTYLKHKVLHLLAMPAHAEQVNELKWQIDLACVYVNPETREGKVVLMDNIHKE